MALMIVLFDNAHLLFDELLDCLAFIHSFKKANSKVANEFYCTEAIYGFFQFRRYIILLQFEPIGNMTKLIDIHLVGTYFLVHEGRFLIQTDLILHNNPTRT